MRCRCRVELQYPAARPTCSTILFLKVMRMIPFTTAGFRMVPTNAIIHYSWDKPQDIGEIVFYDAPYPAGDVNAVRVTGLITKSPYYLPNGQLRRCHAVCLLSTGRSAVYRSSLRPQAMGKQGCLKLKFCHKEQTRPSGLNWKISRDDESSELPYPADQELTLSLYGYPTTPSSDRHTVEG